MPGPLRSLAVVLCLLSSVSLAACGGEDKKDAARGYKGKGFASPVAGDSAPRGYAATTYDSYSPTGKIIADNGFRPWEHGFSFQNYGNEGGPQNMVAANMSDLFGAQVCISGSGDSCVLTPAAQQFMETLNQNMGGGHCMGFSVAALRMFSGHLDATSFGAPTVPKLAIGGNLPLQSELAESF